MTASSPANSPIIVAFDFPTREQALALADTLDPQLCRAKIGKELFTRFGPQIVTDLHDRGYDVFLDLKFHDIPNTVAAAVAAAADLGVWMVNVHASGGEAMLCAARERLASFGNARPLLIAVTVLTSLQASDLKAQHIGVPLDEQVLSLAQLTRNSGLDGVVCSAREAATLRAQLDLGAADDFALVTPGIRATAQQGSDDQQRTLSAAEAMGAGSSYLVIGRPITQSAQPLETLQSLIGDISYKV